MNDEYIPLTDDQLDDTYRTTIRPLIFPDQPTNDSEAPTLILLGGQPGSGKSRASARLVAEHNIASLSGDDLRIFHPDYHRLIDTNPENAGPTLADATRVWVRAAIQDALDNKRSLLLEGSFGDPDVTLSTAGRFRDAGFQVRIVAIASPPVLSIVTAASRYLRNVAAGTPARFTSLSAHNRGYDGTERLIHSTSVDSPADRITIFSRNGNPLFDAPPTHDASASDALSQGRRPDTWGARSTMELLGELKQITNFAIETRNLGAGVATLLAEAHRLALDDVVPRLSVDPDSPQARFIHQSVTQQSEALRRATEMPPPTLDAPTPTPTRRGPEL